MKRFFKILFPLVLVVAIVVLLYSLHLSTSHCKSPSPSEKVDMEHLLYADSVILHSIADGEFPGAVLCVVKRADDRRSMGEIIYHKSYGNLQLYSTRDSIGEYTSAPIPMTKDAIFDLASLTKSVGTTLAFMHVLEEGRVTLNGYVKDYIPDFKAWDSITPPCKGKKQRVVESRHLTIQQLLTHTSGMPAGIYVPRFMERFEGQELSYETLQDSLINYLAREERRLFRPGTDTKYSCLNFILLQRIIESVTGERLNEYTHRTIFEPLGLKNTRWNVTGQAWNKSQAPLIVPTEILPDGTLLRGDVHDPTARIVMGGISGNAGLFSDAVDLATICSMIMNGGEIGNKRVLSEASVAAMMRMPEQYRFSGRTLGWDGRSDVSGCAGDIMTPHNVICHTGYTGTSVAIDMERGIAIILLTNRVHPDDGGSLSRTRTTVANIVMSAIN